MSFQHLHYLYGGEPRIALPYGEWTGDEGEPTCWSDERLAADDPEYKLLALCGNVYGLEYRLPGVLGLPEVVIEFGEPGTSTVVELE